MRFPRLAQAFGISLTSAIAVGAAYAQQAGGPALRIERSRLTGLATFVTSVDGGSITVPVTVAGAGGRPQPVDFVRAYGSLFGVRDPGAELVVQRTFGDDIAHSHTSYGQVYKGVPVFGGVLSVHQDAAGDIIAANGHFFPIPDELNPVPTVTVEAAVARARALLAAGNPAPEQWELVVVDPGWYGDPPAGAHLAYFMVLSDVSAGVREAFFVDAHTGKVLDQWNLMHQARHREVWNDLTGVLVRAEGGPATGDFEADAAYDYSGDLYDYLFRAFGRDSLDNGGATLYTTVHLQSSSCPNAFGGAGGTYFCDGLVTDDIVAHEFGHGLTEYTANLIYQNQPGQLNESFSDVIGEAVDLLNGDAAFPGPPGGTPWPVHGTGPGTDTPNTLRTGCVPSAFMTVNSPGGIAGDYPAQPAAFGPALTAVGTAGDVVVAAPVRACIVDLPFANAGAMAGKVVLVDRGTCTFAEKVKNAQNAGAIAVIVANNVASGLSPMGGADDTITIPSVGISQADGTMIKTAVQSDTVNVTLRTNAAPEVRWLTGEDSTGFGGAIRDMWWPSCMGDPDTANHPYQTCDPADNGGVHSGSGVPNHAFAMLTDGKTFNNQTVTGIGLFKAGAVWYRALTVYLTPTSDFGDAYVAFNQSAADLVGTMIRDPRDGSNYGLFTSDDAAEVDKALLAAEMNTQGLCGANEILNPNPPEKCATRAVLYSDDFESGINGWTVSTTGPSGPPTPYTWVQRSGGLPLSRPGTVWYAADRNIGDCYTQDESAVHSLFSPAITLPPGVTSPTLAFTHYIDSEPGYDGGNIKISVDGGQWQLIPGSAFLYNPYNTVLIASDNTNPMAGQPAWSGSGTAENDWGTSLVDLSGFASDGQTVQLRFDFGKDGCGGTNGWYVDDFELYHCPAFTAPPSALPDPSETYKTRFISFIVPPEVTAAGYESAIRVRLVSLHHVSPPYTGGPSVPFADFEGQIRWVGPPAQYVESSANPTTFYSSFLQCTPYYQDWTTVGLLHVGGDAIVPSSTYEVENVAVYCQGNEAGCAFVAPALTVTTTRWGDIEAPFNPPAASQQPDVADISALVNKFKSALGAPIKARALLVPSLISGPPANYLAVDVGFNQISACVDAFKGTPYPFSPSACP